MKLESQTLSVSELHPECFVQMQQLMRAHYDGVSESQFLADLLAKQWVILLRDSGHLCGFSTQVLFDYPLAGRDVKILFSGDTIIEKDHWGSLALPVAWGRLMLSLCAAHPASELAAHQQRLQNLPVPPGLLSRVLSLLHQRNTGL